MIQRFTAALKDEYRAFLDRNADANYCNDPAWIDILREGYGKESEIFVWKDPATGSIRGGVSAGRLDSALFGRKLVCMPYLDYGGIVAEGAEAQRGLLKALQDAAASERRELEVRGLTVLDGLPRVSNLKTGMLLPLDGGHEAYWKSLDAKVRNQVRKAEKSGVKVVWGREERLDDFYRVFCVNMRDLGSPTHSKGFFAAVLRHLPGAGIGTAHREGRCIGGLFRIRWRRTLNIPWASTLREERIHCPNNALYWETLRHAFESGCDAVDFGRSSKDEGTYKFKQQWLARETPLHWYQFDKDGKCLEDVRHAGSGKLGWAQKAWTRLPLPVATFVGSRIRGSISA
jgi:FemAB-related protein (PEP-CTERM system-associated)